MTLAQVILNLLIAFGMFFVVRYVGSLVVPEGQDRDRIINVIAVIIGVLVFFANWAATIIK